MVSTLAPKKSRAAADPKVEKRAFRIHPKLLFDVIFRQAGSLAKAILEGIMNSVDAEATECRIYLEPNGRQLTIVDNGAGIIEKEQIESFFETFGQPHDASEKKVFGTFRMGRGQMFAYGVNRWRTGPWQMVVDAKNRGLDYDLIRQPRSVTGCEIVIDLYETLSPSAAQETELSIRRWARYAPLEVYWNDERFSVEPGDEKWDHETDEAYIRLNKTGVLSLCNLGVHTLDIAQYQYGTGGVVVTKQQIKVNFARNDVQSDCPVWRKILPFIKQKANDKNLKAPQLDGAGRASLARQIMSGELNLWDTRRAKLVTAVNGRQFTLYELQTPYRYGGQLTVCERNDPLGDKLFQQKLAFVVANETLERFNVKTLEQLGRKLAALDNRFRLAPVVPFQQLTEGLDHNFQLLDARDITANERVWQDVANAMTFWLADVMDENRYSRQRRRIAIGIGPADGWTDGTSYIALGRDFLKTLGFNLQGVVALKSLVLHELCHDTLDAGSHIHTPEFYESYHEADRDAGDAVAKGFRGLVTAIKRQRKGKPLPKGLLGALDTEHQLIAACNRDDHSP